MPSPGSLYTIYFQPGFDPTSLQLDITYGGQAGSVPDFAGPFLYSGASTQSSTQIWRVALGYYAFSWQIPANAPAGVYVATWTYVFSGTFTVPQNFYIPGNLPGGPVGVSSDLGIWTGSLSYPGGALPAATVNFGAVDSNGIAWLWQKIEGWDGPDVVGGTIQRAGDQGAWASAQYFQPRMITLNCMASAPTQALRDTARLLLSAAVPVNDFATLTYNEPLPLQVQVRRAGKITETYPTLADVAFSIPMIAVDPRKYGTQLHTTQVSAIPASSGGFLVPVTVPIVLPNLIPGGTVTVVNAGNFETRPIITINGPVTAPSLTNINQGLQISWSNISLSANDTLVVNFNTRQSLLDGLYSPADPFSTWWTMTPGSNAIFLGGLTGTGCSLAVQWNDAYL